MNDTPPRVRKKLRTGGFRELGFVTGARRSRALLVIAADEL